MPGIPSLPFSDATVGSSPTTAQFTTETTERVYQWLFQDSQWHPPVCMKPWSHAEVHSQWRIRRSPIQDKTVLIHWHIQEEMRRFILELNSEERNYFAHLDKVTPWTLCHSFLNHKMTIKLIALQLQTPDHQSGLVPNLPGSWEA